MISPTDRDGWIRDRGGRFGPGNRGGPGAPRKKATALRRAVRRTCSYDELVSVLRALVVRAKTETAAARTLFDILLRAQELEALDERLRDVEAKLNA